MTKKSQGIRFKREAQRMPIMEKDFGEVSENLRKKIENLQKEDVNTHYGVMHRKKTEPIPIFNEAECEKHIRAESNCGIVLGRDRPDAIGSGYGGVGADGSAMIDLVVGRAGRQRRNTAGDDKSTPLVVDNDIVNDSARIYISERTDIDLNFGIVPGRQGNPTGRSGIGIKADNVRIVAREGIKLVTRTDETNSKDGKMDVVLGVDIIAGDDDSGLQPMVRGTNLRELLLYMVEDMRRMTQMIHSMSLAQATLESMLAAHVHIDPLSGTTLPSIEMGVFCATSQIKRLIFDIPNHIANILNNISLELGYLNPGTSGGGFGGGGAGDKYINSRKNNVN